MTNPDRLLSLIAAVNSEGVLLHLRQSSRAWECTCQRPLPEDREHRPEAPKTYRYAIGYFIHQDIFVAITQAYLTCTEDYEVLSFTPTFTGPAPEAPPADLLKLLGITDTKPQRIGTLRRI